MSLISFNKAVFKKKFRQCLPKVLGTHDEINEKIQILCSTNISMTIVMLEAPPPPSNNVAYCEFAMASTSSLHSSRTCDSDRIKQHCLKGEMGKWRREHAELDSGVPKPLAGIVVLLLNSQHSYVIFLIENNKNLVSLLLFAFGKI